LEFVKIKDADGLKTPVQILSYISGTHHYPSILQQKMGNCSWKKLKIGIYWWLDEAATRQKKN